MGAQVSDHMGIPSNGVPCKHGPQGAMDPVEGCWVGWFPRTSAHDSESGLCAHTTG